jgi:predicted AlkP superfamily pyrophosphatase or phosphodiesterase
VPSPRKLLVVNVAGLGWELVSRHQPPGAGFAFRQAETVFPAVTCTVQASFRTATPPSDHGMIANGLLFRHIQRVMFWEQAAALVVGPRIWDDARRAGKKVGLLFWQQSLGEHADFILTPKPVHKHHGGMIQDCYSQPHDLYGRLCATIGRPFELMDYWGPLASVRANEWIVDATCEIMRSPDLAPDLLFTYLPGLDYDLQRHGPNHRKSFHCLEKSYADFSNLWKNAEASGYDVLLFGDYNIEQVTGGPVFPNLRLREAGLFATRTVDDAAYPDFFASGAFAVADHQVAHVYCADEPAVRRAEEALKHFDGIGEILGRREQHEAGLDLERSGDLVLVAQKGHWFAYPWWTDRREAPDYATHVDIHNKPGYDPCELFFGWLPMSVSTNAAKVRGTHGRRGPGTGVAWASSLKFEKLPNTVIDLSLAVKKHIETT